MANIFGYTIAIIGLIIIALSKKIAEISFIASIPKASVYVTVLGVIIIALGVLLLRMSNSSGRSRQEAEEVPIYRGKKIVGYRKE